MEYNFTIHETTITETKWFYVNVVSEKYQVLNNLTSHNWNLSIAQELIDNIELSKNGESNYMWQNEDLLIISNKHAVFFIDLISNRGKNIPKEKQDLDLTHDEFLNFMEDFKVFIIENT